MVAVMEPNFPAKLPSCCIDGSWTFSGIILMKASRTDSGGNGVIPPSLKIKRKPSDTSPAIASFGKGTRCVTFQQVTSLTFDLCGDTSIYCVTMLLPI